jgi:hypothetical protein
VGTQNRPYEADFPKGSKVRIKSREFLEQFQRTWKFHHPIEDFQLQHAGQVVKVDSIGYYFGADELYTLERVQGIWNECCLEPPEE